MYPSHTHGEEIAGQHGVPVSAKELAPGAGALAAQRCWRDVAPLQGIPDRRAPEGVAELGQFPLEPPVAPARVLRGQPQEQRLHLGGQRRSSPGGAPPAGPLAAHELAVPLQDGLGLDQQHRAGEAAP
jgi:hypothetical protein